MRNLGGQASTTTHLRVVWDIHVVNSDVPDAPADPDSDQYSASYSFSRVQQPDEVEVARYRRHAFDGIDPRVMSVYDLHVLDSAPA
jgi:hypothetical protein